MAKFLFGSLQFSRDSIPMDLRDLRAWPIADEESLSEDNKRVYIAREEAIRLFVETDMPVRRICESTKVSTSTLYRLFQRCCDTHSDGRIFGFRALIPFFRIKKYERRKEIKGAGLNRRAGKAGALGKLLNEHPNIKEKIIREVKKRSRRKEGIEIVRNSYKRIHAIFLDECRKSGILANQYPFTEDYCAQRSLYTYIKKNVLSTFHNAANDAGVPTIASAPSSNHEPKEPAFTRAFQAVEFDGHKLDLRTTLTIKDPYGLETKIELNRLWILVILELMSKAVLGYSIGYEIQYSASDVSAALQSALLPHTPRNLRIPGLKIRDGGGFPSQLIEDAQFACWNFFRCDNASSHIAATTLDRLTRLVGCWTKLDPPGEPNKRPFIESFFRLLSKNFAHRIVGTTGCSTDDIVRKLGDRDKNLHLLIELEELEDLIEVTLADYNGTAGASGRTPIEALTYLMSKEDCLIRHLPSTGQAKIALLQDSKIVTVRGNVKDGVRPHINFEHVRYTNDVLARQSGLINKKVRIFFKPSDIRTLIAFFEDGSELGVLMAARPWCYTPHSLRVRQEIFRLKSLRRICFTEDEDPVATWVRFKKEQAITNKKAAGSLAQNRNALEFQQQNGVLPDSAENAKARSQEKRNGEAESPKPTPRKLTLNKTIRF